MKNRASFTQAALSWYNYEKVLFGIIFLNFSIKSFYFALNIREKVFPDEASWFGITEIFSRSFFPPQDSPESYVHGLITHIPNFYFYLMGKALSLNIFAMNDLLFLRLANVLMGTITIYYAWKVMSFLCDSVAARILFVIMISNTLMFTFMFGAVSYDNLTSLLSVLSLYYFLNFLKLRRGSCLLLCSNFILLGLLTKLTLLPYVLALIIIAIIDHLRKRAANIDTRVLFFSENKIKNIFLLSLCFILFCLNLNLHLGNKLRFGSIILTMEKVLPIEACLKNRIFARDYAVREFKAGRIPLLEAQRLALQIRDPGDRAFSWEMIEKARDEKKEKADKERVGRLPYTVEWTKYIFTRTYSIAGHLVMSKNDKELLPYYAVFALSCIMLIFRLRKKSMQEMGLYILFVTLFYLVILCQVVNYQSYFRTGFVGLALTGRYVFPVLVPMYILMSHALMDKMPRWWQVSVGLAVSAVFVYGEFPWFMKNVTAEWFF